MSEIERLHQKFIEQCSARLKAGEQEYGGRSFVKANLDLVEEIQQELLDTANWSFILWVKLERLRERLKDLK